MCIRDSPVGALVTSDEEAQEAAKKLKYPLIVRPSYVLGGRAMEIVYNDKELDVYMKEAVVASKEHPVLIDRYMAVSYTHLISKYTSS